MLELAPRIFLFSHCAINMATVFGRYKKIGKKWTKEDFRMKWMGL